MVVTSQLGGLGKVLYIEALIHLYPTLVFMVEDRVYAFSALKPTRTDQIAFREYSTNIIVGALSPLGQVQIKPDGTAIIPKRTNGVAIYNSNARLQVSLSESAVKKIIK